VFRVFFTLSASEDLHSFRKSEQQLILGMVRVQLTHEPVTESSSRKRLEPNPLGPWELRIGDFRVFYAPDVDAETVSIAAVGIKEHNSLYVRGKVFPL
jgi:mRNA-degrading endonuclease RelE of RelBE toxin-antitoxin system